MATIQAVLRKKPNKARLFPIAIRVTKDRKSSYLFTGQYIEEKFWDGKYDRIRKSHPNSNRLNKLVAKKLSEANDKLIDSDAEGTGQSAKKIKKKIVGKSKMDFFQVSGVFLANLLKRKKFNQHYNQEIRLNIFNTFLGRKELYIYRFGCHSFKRFQGISFM